jgi:RHS repeat-associated protein
MLSAAKDESVPLLAASLLSENSRPGFGGCDSELRRVIELANVLNASGLATSLYDDRIGSRDTGKERDSESGLDYFGARYFGSALGRFTSPDPESASASLFDPQRWNAYSYAVNNPYKFVDPDGENPLLISAGVGLVVGAAGGALFDVGNQLIQNGVNFDQINGREVLGATIGGAVSGGIAGLTLGLGTAPASLTAGYLATSAVVNGGANVVGGIVQRDIDPDASGSVATDFAAGAIGGAVGTKVAYVRYPLPNVKKELEAISFSNRRSLRPGKVVSLNARAASQATKNVVTGSVLGTAVANFFSTLWSDLTHTSSSPKACVEAHDSHGNGTGQTCSN